MKGNMIQKILIFLLVCNLLFGGRIWFEFGLMPHARTILEVSEILSSGFWWSINVSLLVGYLIFDTSEQEE